MLTHLIFSSPLYYHILSTHTHLSFLKGAPPLNRELELEDIKVCPTYLQLCKRKSLFYPCTLHIWPAQYKYKYAATTLLPGYNFSHHSTSRYSAWPTYLMGVHIFVIIQS